MDAALSLMCSLSLSQHVLSLTHMPHTNYYSDYCVQPPLELHTDKGNGETIIWLLTH